MQDNMHGGLEKKELYCNFHSLHDNTLPILLVLIELVHTTCSITQTKLFARSVLTSMTGLLILV